MVWGICQDMARKVSLSLSTGEQKRTTFLVTEDGPKVRLDTGPEKAEVTSLCTEDGAQPLKVSPAMVRGVEICMAGPENPRPWRRRSS